MDRKTCALILFISWGFLAEAYGQSAGKIVFASHRKGRNELRMMRSNGSGDKLILAGKSWVLFANPVWSPDGKTIAFSRYTRSNDSSTADIYLVKPNGRGLKRLTSAKGADLHPSWSPDGKRIVFDSDRSGDSRLYVMDADGRNQNALTDAGGIDSHPAWSPDGGTIVFSTNRTPEWGDTAIAAIDESGGNFRLLAYSGFDETDPAWSPDGSRIAFTSFRDATAPGQWTSWEIYVMNADGSAQTRLTYDLTRYDLNPTWSPDGTKLMWGSRVGGGNSRLNIMNSDGSDQRALRQSGKTSNAEPNWR